MLLVSVNCLESTLCDLKGIRLIPCVCSSVYSSIHAYHNGYHWMDICEIWYWGLFWRCQENPNLIKIRKNFWHFRSEYVLVLVTEFNYHWSALFGWNSIRLLGIAEEVRALWECLTVLHNAYIACLLFANVYWPG